MDHGSTWAAPTPTPASAHTTTIAASGVAGPKVMMTICMAAQKATPTAKATRLFHRRAAKFHSGSDRMAAPKIVPISRSLSPSRPSACFTKYRMIICIRSMAIHVTR
jgi:hypothetical protein